MKSPDIPGRFNTTVAECEIDLTLSERINIITVADTAMGKYAGTRWPMECTFTCSPRAHF